jgi:Icc-related predicted phosphoesterase
MIMMNLTTKAYCKKKKAITYSSNISNRQHIKSFILVGDTQKTSIWEFWREKNMNVRNSVLKKISEENPAFVLHLGDLVYQGDSHCHWQDFNKYAEEIYQKSIPILPILGNHDYYGNKRRALKNYFLHFPGLNKKKYYSCRFQYMGLILLNSNFDKMNNVDLNKQINWYKKELDQFQKDSTIKIILVAFHHPPYTNSKIVNDDLEVQKYFIDSVKDLNKVKLFFSGHCHSYEHFKDNYRHFIVSGGGGGSRHSLHTEKDRPVKSDINQIDQNCDFNFCKIILLEEGIQVNVFRMDKDFEWMPGEEIFVKK